MVSTPIETLLEGKGFSCEAGGNWTGRKGQEIECVAFGACGMGVIVWPKNRMISRRVSSLIDMAGFLLPGH